MPPPLGQTPAGTTTSTSNTGIVVSGPGDHGHLSVPTGEHRRRTFGGYASRDYLAQRLASHSICSPQAGKELQVRKERGFWYKYLLQMQGFGMLSRNNNGRYCRMIMPCAVTL
eukprot:77377-Rhodomonas_salina.1